MSISPFIVATAVVILRPDDAAPLLVLRELDRRVLTVGSQLREAASFICDRTRYDSGWALHGLGQYRLGLQSIASGVFAIGADQVGVLALEEGGPASQAGVQENDVLVAVAGHSIVLEQPAQNRLDHHSVDMTIAQIELFNDRPEVNLRVRRSGQEFDLIIRPRLRCDWKVQVTPSQDIEAKADGRYISVSSRLVDMAEQDSVLAFILAHEMAHNLQREQNRFSARPIREREREADRIGLILAAHAGYDTSGAGDFVRHLGRLSWFSRLGWGAHDSPETRAAALDRLHQEIASRGADAFSLMPEQAPD